MSGKSCLVIGILLAGLSVGLGAFGAHRLENKLNHLEPAVKSKKIENWKTASTYQLFHALGVISIGIIMIGNRGSQGWLNASAILILFGVLLFSGSLYWMTLSDVRLGMVVPLGGISLIAGWSIFAIGAARLEP
jgi:uncharacterized membrane protein YgdD (TMEM256/DUF423 family)